MSGGLQGLEYFRGSWGGSETGKAGTGSDSRTYAQLLGRFVECRNRSEFAPQEANPNGEVHEDLVIYSYDEGAATIVARAFHTEGFVITYHLAKGSEDDLVFASTEVENGPPGLGARLTLHIEGPDAFEEVFELGPADGPFEEYLRNHWTRRS